MDILAHSLYGITVCSKTGLGGGRAGSGRQRFIEDITLWQAVFFSLLPDMVSMGAPFLVFLFGDRQANFFHEFTDRNIVLYRYMHSLVTSLVAAGLIALIRRSWAVPALAWSVHVLCDSITHNAGKFRTTLFYPFTDWGFDGFAFWMDSRVLLVYWAILPIVWILLRLFRRKSSRVIRI